MTTLKKLSFAPLFLLSLAFFYFLTNPLIQDYSLLFSLDLMVFLQILAASLALVLSSVFFIVFCTLSQNLRFVLIVTLLSCLIPLGFISSLEAFFVLAVLNFGAFLLIFYSVSKKMKTYLSFEPAFLFSSTVKHLTGLLILTTCLVYFLNISTQIKQNGFEIPDSLIDSALKLTGVSPTGGNLLVKGDRYIAQSPTITKEQLDYLKKHPELLKMYNIDPQILDSITSPTQVSPNKNVTNSTEKISLDPKALIKSQVQNMLKPYQAAIPIVLAVTFFLSLQFFSSLFLVFSSPLFRLIYLILEKTKFIHFEKELREVKKLVV